MVQARGFISVVVIITIFLVTIILMNISYQDTETISFKERLLDEKLLLTDYELAMNRAMSGRPVSPASVDGNSAEVLAIIQPAFTTCTENRIEMVGQNAEVDLACTTDVGMAGETKYRNAFSKTVTITGG